MRDEQHQTPGLFITFEGGDGSGKTTQAKLAAQWLHDTYAHDVLLTREPGGTDLGRHIRELVLHGQDMGPRAEALLYAADRAHHVHSLVRPALEDGRTVVCDRYFDSSIAYQGGGRTLTPTAIRDLSLWAVDGLLPDLTILIDVTAQVGASRLVGAPDRLERAGAGFHDRTLATYRQLAEEEPHRWAVVDGDGTIEQVAQRVQQVLSTRLSEHLGSRTDGGHQGGNA